MQITSDLSVISILLIGFFLGLQHAVESDHLAAVSTIVSEKKNLLTAALVGGLWGAGHTIALFVMGAIVIFLKVQVSKRVEVLLEGMVGVMLVMLGLNALRKLFGSEKIHIHKHQHGEREHIHIHSHSNERSKTHHGFSPRSILVGVIHGLAGSAALMLLILPVISSPFAALLYIVIFGVGSIGGMMAMSFLIGLPLHFTAARFGIVNGGIRFAAAVFSLGLGGFIVYDKLAT